ncbi:MAG: hypothetical protein EBZ77_01305 [Chitinophagia bacterium]|nr:hypothetical protein [Chitinophagia bacterium]
MFLLPFILGVMGLVYQFNRNRNDGIVVLMMFFFTGAAIGIFLNMPPLQPRERDYAFAGCTYTFTIWIGLGVLMLRDVIERAVKGPAAIYGAIGISLVAVPVLMAGQEWDDHDRSRKTLATAVAHNTLDACAPNAVLFTFGDNQTYPLWYAQEIEGYRKDVRVINTSLLGIDWYVDQLNYRINDADAVPMMWKKENYIGSNHNYLSYYDNPALKLPKNQYINLIDVCKFSNSNDPQFMAEQRNGEKVNYLPTKNFFVPVPSKEDLVKNGMASAADTARIISEMKFTYPKEVAYKSDLAVLNIIAAVARDGWKRPLYFDAGLRQGDYGGTGDFMRLEGTVYRLMPYRIIDSNQRQSANLGTVNTDKSYDLYMHFDWGGAQRNDVYFDEPNRHELYSYRVQATSIATALIGEGKKDKAIMLLDKVNNGITEHSYYYDVTGYFMAAAYYQAGAKDKASKIGKKVLSNIEGYLNWVSTLSENSRATVAYETTQQLRIMQFLGRDAYMAGDSATAQTINNVFGSYQSKFQDIIRAANAGAGGGDEEN